jgi:hypothetical protein
MKTLKSIFALAMLTVLTIAVNAQDLPQPSPSASFTQRFGVTDITMNYSRPSVKGRTIWGDLVPFDKVWRAGANSSTKIEFSTPVTIGGKEVKAGKYALYIIPSENSWVFIISSYLDGWGVGEYTEATDVVRVKAEVMESEMTENLLFSVDNIKNSSSMLTLSWEKIKVGFMIEANTKEYATANLTKLVKEADGSFSTYNKAAAYLLDNGGDKKEALALAIKSTNQQKKFWNMTVLSEAYAANDDIKMAVKTAKEALELSEKAEYGPYIKRNNANLDKWAK